MKKNFCIIFLILFSVNHIFSQITLNPEHSFYSSVQSWQNRGIINSVPSIRPYPVSSIKEILHTVIENGSNADKEIAQEYLNEVNEKPWLLSLNTSLNLKNENSDNKFLYNISPAVKGNVNLLEDSFNIAYKLGLSLRNDYYIEHFLPSYSNYQSDARFDPAKIKSIQMFLESNDIFSYRNKGLILQGGIFRSGYGDFLNEGLALNDTAFHRPTLQFSYSNKLFAYNQSFSMLGATINNPQSSRSKNTKYLAFHSIELSPFSWLSGAFYETSVFGKRFDFSYLLPTPFMIAQSFSGYADSLMMGARLKITPFSAFSIKTDLLVDDLDVNRLLKFNFNSKNRVAWNTGFEFTPEPKLINKIALNFLIVTPYTYTHWDVNNEVTEEITLDTINYQNYTNCGYTIGSTLPPNSSQIKLDFDFTPLRNLKINIFGSLIFHANINESLTEDEQLLYLIADKNVYSTDGSIFNHTYYYSENNSEVSGYLDTAWNFMNFLNQAHKMTIVQTGINADYNILKKSWGSLKLKAVYTFEFIKNKGVDSDMLPGLVKYNPESESYTYTSQGSEITTTNKREVIDYYKDQWISNFYNQTNHFLYLALEYNF